MRFIQTVSGKIEPDQLGTCVFHEHTLLDWSEMLGLPRASFDHVEAYEQMRALLTAFSHAGGRSLVDAGMTWFGPEPWLCLLLTYGTDINIIGSVGFFHEMDCPMPARVYSSSVDELAAWLAEGITQGVNGTGVRAGVLKAASSSERITPAEEKAIRAVARAQLLTGAGVITHVTSPVVQSRLGLEQARLFRDEGVDLSKVVIGHMGWDTTPAPLEYHLEVAATGANLGYDQIGHSSLHDDDYWIGLIAEMVSRGLADKVFLSHDSVGAWVGRNQVDDQQLNHTYSHILTEIVPRLKAAGISDEVVHTMLVENPKRLLTIDRSDDRSAG